MSAKKLQILLPPYGGHTTTQCSRLVKLGLLIQVKSRAKKNEAGIHVNFYMHTIMEKKYFHYKIVILFIA